MITKENQSNVDGGNYFIKAKNKKEEIQKRIERFNIRNKMSNKWNVRKDELF